MLASGLAGLVTLAMAACGSQLDPNTVANAGGTAEQPDLLLVEKKYVLKRQVDPIGHLFGERLEDFPVAADALFMKLHHQWVDRRFGTIALQAFELLG